MTRGPGVGRSGAQSDEGDGAARWRAPIPAFPPSRSPTMTPLRRRMIGSVQDTCKMLSQGMQCPEKGALKRWQKVNNLKAMSGGNSAFGKENLTGHNRLGRPFSMALFAKCIDMVYLLGNAGG